MLYTNDVSAQDSQGITFTSGKWQDVLAEAKKSGKPIFVDVYTSWCLPCKKMEHEIFPLKAVGSRFNKDFICYRIDAEKGEGIAISKKYAVVSYPTYLFINADGILFYRGLGYNQDPTVFLTLADNALKRQHSKFTIDDMQKMYQDGERKPEFVVQYIETLSELGMKEETSLVLDNYMETLPNSRRLDTANAKFLLRYVNNMQSKVFNYILQHQSAFTKIALPDNAISPDIITNTNEEKLGILLSGIVFQSLFKATSTKNNALFNEVLAHANQIQHTSLKFPYTLFAFSLQFYRATKDTTAILKEAKLFLPKIMNKDAATLKKDNREMYESFLYPYITGQSDSSKIPDFEVKKASWEKNFSNYLASILYTGADQFLAFAQSENDLNKSIKWCQRALQIGDKKPEYLNTLALLYYKTGKPKEALKKQEEALLYAQQLNASKNILEKYQSDLDRIKMKK